MTVIPLPKTTPSSSIDTATVSTTCEEEVVASSSSFPVSASPASSSSVGVLPVVATAGHNTTTAEDTPSVFTASSYGTSESVNSSTDQPSQEFDGIATSTIRITSTSIFIVATVTGASFPESQAQAKSVKSTDTTDDPFPEPYATKPPNVPPYVQQTSTTTVSVPSTQPALVLTPDYTIHESVYRSANQPSLEVDDTFTSTVSITSTRTVVVATITASPDAPVTTKDSAIEISTKTITSVVTVYPDACEKDVATEQDSNEPQSMYPTTAAETETSTMPSVTPTDLSIVSHLPTVYSYHAMPLEMNTLFTQTSNIGSVATYLPTTIVSDSGASNVYTKYASLFVVGLVAIALAL